ncbi:MAG TPA: hypothetical protein PKC29_02015 [Thermodesulfobacteriota bacterium]|nr:hypothetical protein [Thermodesulfobacteriota bacterium]
MSQNRSTAFTQINTAEIVGIGKELEARLREIDEDVTLSPQGKAQESQAARSEADKKLTEAKQKHRDGVARLSADLQRTLAGEEPKRSFVDRIRNKGMSEDTSNREVALTNYEGLETVVKAIRDMTQMNLAATLDQKGLLAAADRFMEQGNLGALESLAKVAAFRGDTLAGDKISASVQAVKEASLTIPQKIARKELERLTVHEAMIDQAIEYARRGGKALDLLENGQGLRDADERIDFEIKAIQLGAKPEGGSD